MNVKFGRKKKFFFFGKREIRKKKKFFFLLIRLICRWIMISTKEKIFLLSFVYNTEERVFFIFVCLRDFRVINRVNDVLSILFMKKLEKIFFFSRLFMRSWVEMFLSLWKFGGKKNISTHDLLFGSWGTYKKIDYVFFCNFKKNINKNPIHRGIFHFYY